MKGLIAVVSTLQSILSYYLYNWRYIEICLELSESPCTSYINSKSHIVIIFLSHVKNRYIFVTLGNSVIVTIVRDLI